MVSTRRATALMAVLLVLIGGYFAAPSVQRWLAVREQRAAGPDRITVQRTEQTARGEWTMTYDYHFAGAPEDTNIHVTQKLQYPQGAASGPATFSYPVHRAEAGTRGRWITVRRPPGQDLRTTELALEMRAGNGEVLATAKVPVDIDWGPTPSHQPNAAVQPAKAVVAEAVRLIDLGDRDSLLRARDALQKLVARDPKFDAAYVELARVAMKTNWSPQGLHDAENLLRSALQIRPDSVNAKILLGYVFAHQRRFAEAEALFVEAAAANPPNLWLWSNWGELLAMQGQDQAAIEKYREGLRRPPTGDTYDRARHDAYDHLLALLEAKKDTAAMGALHRQRTKEYPDDPCFRIATAQFVILQEGNAKEAGDLVRPLPPDTACPDGAAREVVALTHYLAWSSGTAPDRTAALNQARVLMPVSAWLLYQLASSERFVPAAEQLLAGGEKIGMKDRRQFDALAYAIRDRNFDAARRLLKLGARADATIGAEEMPIALMPVLTGDVEGIRFLQRAGVDYAKVRFRGATAIDIVKSTGNAALLQALEPKRSSL